MPGGLFEADTRFPDLTGQQSVEQKLIMIQDYLYLLLENLRWTLRNLSPENFNETEMKPFFEKLEANVVISNTVITNELYADYGAIADLTVNELRTDYQKAARYLNPDPAVALAPLDFLYIHDEVIDFLTGTVITSGGVPLTEQLHHGTRFFWWTDNSHTQMTSLEDTGLPVMVYQYSELVKGSFRFDTVNGVKIPTLILGAGVGDPSDPDIGKTFIRKETNRFLIRYKAAADRDTDIAMADFVDAKHRRLKSCDIDTGNGTVVYTVEGDNTVYGMSFDVNGDTVTYTWPDGFQCEVSIT